MSVLLDTSIIIPYLAGLAYDRYVWVRLVREQVLVSSVSAMEVLAGSLREDKRRKVESFVEQLRSRERLITPTDEDWLCAGRILARYQVRYGHIDPSAHIADVLILLAAYRTGTELATENGAHFRTWSRFLPERRKPRLEVLDRQAHLSPRAATHRPDD